MNTKAMNKITYGLYVLSARDGARDNACIINTACQVTSTPNRITIAVNRETLTHDMVLATGLFNISTLSEEAPFSVFRRFGFQSGRTADKFGGFADIARSENGLYYITSGVSALLSARVASATDLGSHTLFLADVTDCEILSETEPMSYSYYHRFVKESAPAATGKGWRCTICNYVYEGDPLPPDFICPVCKHGAEDFERIG